MTFRGRRTVLDILSKQYVKANSSIIFGAGTIASCAITLACFASALIIAPATSAMSININVSPITRVDATATNAAGKFSTSPVSNISVSTDNYNGYTLSIKAANNNTDNPSMNNALINTVDNTKYIPSIPSGSSISPANFADDTYASSNNLNNTWGYLPSFYNSSANTNYIPAPTDTINGDILNETHCANGGTNGSYNCPNNTDNYTITLGTRINMEQTPGIYNNTFIITAVANGTPYTITYNKNAGSDTVSNMPTNVTVSDNAVSYADTIILNNTTPTRTGYTFAGWCDTATGTTQTSCGGTMYTTAAEFASFPIDRTASSNDVNVYAIWTANNYTCTKQYRLQNANGTWGSYQSDTTEQVAYGSTCSYSKSVTNYKNTASGINNASASTTGTMNSTSGITLSLSFYRNTYTLTVNRNTTYISSASATTSAVHGSNYYRWGQAVSITATASSGNEFTSWTQSGTAGTFANAKNASTTFTMGKGNVTVTAGGKASCTSTTFSGYMQSMSASTVANACVGDTGTLTDRRDNKTYNVAKLADEKLWMTENLAIDLTTTSYDTLYGTGTNAGKMTNATSQALKYLKGTNTGTSSDQWATAGVSKTWTSSSQNYHSQPMIAVDSSTSGVCNDASTWCVSSTGAWSSTTVTPATINGTTSIAQGKIGVYYNYCAASAGSHCWGNGTSNTGSPTSDPNTSSLRDITSDICPYGWRLPTSNSSGEFKNLYTQYSSNATNFQSALVTPLSGYFFSGKANHQGDEGFFWSSTWSSRDNMYTLLVSSRSVFPSYGHDRRYGNSVRCLLGS